MDVRKPKDIKGLVFDKDGTLFDFADTWEAWAQAFLLRLCGQEREKARQIGRRIGFDLEAAKFAPDSIVIAGTPFEVTDALLPFFPDISHAELLGILNDEAESAPQKEVVPLVPFLGGLRQRGLKLGVATNDSEGPALTHLGRAGVTDLFDFIAGSDSGHGGKPAPGQLHAFSHVTGLPPQQVAMVGDSLHDLHAGRAAGMMTVGVLTGLAGRDTLAPCADVVLPDISHLPDWLDGR